MARYADVIPAARTHPTRQDTQAILSYYQSSLADQPYMGDQETEHELNLSHGVDFSPLSSFANGTHTKDDDLGSTAKHRRKHNISNSTDNSTPNRKAAIVPLEVLDTHEEQEHLPASAASIATTTLPLAGRKLVVEAQLAASALVAPRDSNLVSLHDIPFSSLTPSLLPTVSPTAPSLVRSSSSTQGEHSRKARTTSSHSKSSSRDIGIVGTRRESVRKLAGLSQDTPSDLKPPIFQTPTARSPSPQISVSADTSESDSSAQHIPSDVSHAPPAAMSTSVEPMHSVSPMMNGPTGYQPRSAPSLITSSSRHQGISTPEQGQASPSSATSMSVAPSSYLFYQPGLHSKAGPLPPPPRAMFDIDFSAPPPPRPPRLRSPSPLTSKRGSGESTTPTSVTLRLSSKTSVTSIHHQIQISTTPPPNNESSSSEGSVYSPERTSTDAAVHHIREGAFPPSTILVVPPERQQSLPGNTIRLVAELPSKDQLPDLPTDSPDAVPPVITQPANDDRDPTTAHPPELRRERSWVSSSNNSISSESGRRAFEDARFDVPQDSDGSPPSIREIAPEEGPSSSPRRGVLTNLKRYSSLPRTPSTRSPRSTRMSIFTRSSSPESLSRPRIRARSPDAMQFKDVLAKKTSLERAIGYANKINELAMYDCGLGDWVGSMKERGNSRTRLVSSLPPHPSETLLVPRPRHTSRASISSEMTFPLRADAYIATDLSPRDTDTLPSPNVPPPALPYPALAGVQPTINFRHSTMIGSPLSYAAPLSAAGSKATSGFFASLGRNTSTRKDSNHVHHKPSISHARLTKPSSATTAPNPRPVQLTSAPSVPGGPRALPIRMQRSRTLMLAPSPPSSESTSPSPPMRRRSNTLKRPSFFGRSPGPSPDLDTAPASTEFTRQVEKLGELLPHADKDVLAGYLRRAGQDILAIGQYLEDEKNGSLRRD
ncbi:hypothetical protein EDB84DRAFT_1556429 [Lactarius hengduanensis]|nr:hypothetical protein EDB84DRAFT_1556429 [Lactarius hengduanensis]